MTRGCAMPRSASHFGNKHAPVSRAEKTGECDLCRVVGEGAILCRGVAPAYFIAARWGEVGRISHRFHIRGTVNPA